MGIVAARSRCWGPLLGELPERTPPGQGQDLGPSDGAEMWLTAWKKSVVPAELAGSLLSEACWREQPSRGRRLPGGPELQGRSVWAGVPGSWCCVPLSLQSRQPCLLRGLSRLSHSSPSISFKSLSPLPALERESSRACAWFSSLAVLPPQQVMSLKVQLPLKMSLIPKSTPPA